MHSRILTLHEISFDCTWKRDHSMKGEEQAYLWNILDYIWNQENDQKNS